MPKFHYSHVCISNLVYQIIEDIIDLNPPYQRGDVWTLADRQSLISSVIDKRYPIPSISLATNPHNFNIHESEVVDGRQRLTTLAMFRDDKFKYDGCFYSEMDPRKQALFDMTQIQLCTIENPSDTERREYFRRLQMGHQLRVTEVAWSYDDEPLVRMLHRLRNELLSEIEVFTPIGRHADLTILINLYDIFTSNTPKVAGRLHSTSLKCYIERNTDDPDIEVEQRIRTFIHFLSAVYGVTQPVDKGSIRSHFPLDIARIFALNEFRCDEEDVENVALFVNKLNDFVRRYNLGDDFEDTDVSSEYFFSLVEFATSASYTKKNTDARMSVLTRLF
jgi:hypothetical protein